LLLSSLFRLQVLQTIQDMDRGGLERRNVFPCHVPLAIPLKDPINVDCEHGEDWEAITV
jgi:hypothetical protein